MLHSIRGRLVLAVAVIVVLLGALIYFTSAEIRNIETTLADLRVLEDVKSHVLIPQKDMNQFLAAMDTTVLFLELGDAEAAQSAYESSVDAEQDISAEFAFLKEEAPGELSEIVEQAHLDWEIATEFLKIKAEALADEKGLALVRPSTEPTKVVDSNTDEAIAIAQAEFGGRGFAELAALQDDDETNPIEIADAGIDASEDTVDEILEAERAAGDEAVASSARTVLLGSIAVLLAIVVIGAFATLSVSRPLAMLKTGAEHIAEGDLDYEFADVPADEVGSVIHSVEKMARGLKDRIRNLEEVAGVVMVAGESISAAAASAKAEGANVDAVIEKADELKSLVGQMLDATKRM